MIFSKLFRTDIYWKIQENLRRKSMEMDERIQENDRAFEQEKAGSFRFLKVKNYRWMNLWSVCGND